VIRCGWTTETSASSSQARRVRDGLPLAPSGMMRWPANERILSGVTEPAVYRSLMDALKLEVTPMRRSVNDPRAPAHRPVSPVIAPTMTLEFTF
jgi:hypothetical protein